VAVQRQVDPVRVVGRDAIVGGDPRDPPEWLVANGLGGFAAGTVTGPLTRRYHGWLVAALPPPLGRWVMLDALEDRLELPDGRSVRLDSGPIANAEELPEPGRLAEFRLELGLPVWQFEVDGIVVERRLAMLHGTSTVVVTWWLLAGAPRVGLGVRPLLHVRGAHAPVAGGGDRDYALRSDGDRYEIACGREVPSLKLWLQVDDAPAPDRSGAGWQPLYYPWEEKVGYDCRGGAWSPCTFRLGLDCDRDAGLILSADPWEAVPTLAASDALHRERERRRRLIAAAHPALASDPARELVLAADSFIITPPRGNLEPSGAGEEPVRTVIAGYHWFTDWGRDTMISLEGLTLVTGRHGEARGILRTFARHVRDGLIPNVFPEHETDGVYNTADATLWFFHALDRHLQVSGDRALLRELLPTLQEIIRQHLQGTRFGIGADPADGLLRQGSDGCQLTWMDAKVDGWVVTPRHGKAVEINALWYNALRLLDMWLREEGAGAELPDLAATADLAFRSFNRRFWFEPGRYLYDVVDGGAGDDPSLRPNQLMAISLRYPVLERARWRPVVEAVARELLTPVGLRTLPRGHPDYRGRYGGDLRSRDAAYHQGTVWGWLIGPFVDAWLKVNPRDREGARGWLAGFEAHLSRAGLGSIGEIFEGDPPFAPRGCISQAWSVAEYLRCWCNTEGGRPAGR